MSKTVKPFTAFEFCYEWGELDREQANWKPRVGRWDKKWLQFFGNWKKAPKNSQYRIIGREIARAAKKFKLTPGGHAGLDAKMFDDLGKLVAELRLRQNQWFDDFELVDFVECSIRVTPEFAKALKR